MDVLLGIDVGQTRTKALLVDVSGRQVAVVTLPTEVSHPQSHWAERDLVQLWSHIALTVHALLAGLDRAVEVVTVGVSGHSDGLYLVDEAGSPVRPAIMATDSRARALAEELGSGAVGSRLLEVTGQVPMPATPGVLLRWLHEHEPESLEKARWIMSSTDWLRFMLTGSVATDPTMASASFTALAASGAWSRDAVALYGLHDLGTRLPPIAPSDAVVGEVTDAAAVMTGLRPGTPVVAGAHDVDTGAVGLGATLTGSTSIILGTYAINQVLQDAPLPDRRWQVRPFLDAARWLHMSTSPAGAGCLHWAVGRIGPWDSAGAPDSGAAVEEAQQVGSSAEDPLFLPFVHGAPFGSTVGGSWLGLRSEHDRASMLRAVLEGVVFSHRSHMEALRDRIPVDDSVRVGGGGARSAGWTQLLSDALGLSVEVTGSEEVSAFGAALLAGRGAGAFDSVDEAVASSVLVTRRHQPAPGRAAELDERYGRYLDAVRVLGSLEPPSQG